MHFVIVVIALVLFRYFHLGYHFKRFQWFQDYFKIITTFLNNKTKIEDGYSGLLALIFPIWFLVAIFYGLLHSILFGFLGFVMALGILIYCLDPENHLELFFHTSGQSEDKIKEVDLSVSKITVSSFYDYFAVSFWFVILGPLAALLYRLVERVYVLKSENKPEAVHQAAKLALDILDWIPSRVYTLGFALMGHFIVGFDFWFRNIINAGLSTDEFIEQSARVSLDLQADDYDHPENVLALVDRTFVLYLVILALVIVSRFI